MKDIKTNARRLLAVMLSVWICIAFMPFSAFAFDEVPGDTIADQENVTDVVEAEEYDEAALEETYPEDEVQPDEAFEEELTGLDADSSCEHELVAVPAEAATCQHTGHLAYRECTKCGAIFDSIDPVEVNYDDLITPIADHNWKKTSEVPATTTKPGKITYTCTVCGTTRSEETKPVPATAKSLTIDSTKLQFSKAVVKSIPSSLKNSTINHIWIKAAKKYITLKWDLAKNMKPVDGVIILRKDGKSKVYKEVKRIAFRKSSSSTSTPKTSFKDTKASKKNTPYSYVIVTYQVKDGYTYISHCSPWAAGQTTASKLKNAYSGKINKKSANLQYKGKATLKITQSKPKKFYNPKSVRWYSDNTKIAKVSSKGKVTAVGVGSTTIRGRLASGADVTCKVSVVGAFKPSAPKLKVDIASESSITLIWNSVKYATAYDVYRSDDGLHWKSPVRVKSTTKKFTGLKKGHRYTFYVVAVNVNDKYTAKSTNSNVLNQKAVIKRRPTELTGWPTSKTLKSGSTYSVTIKLTNPTARKASLQMYSGSKWVTKKTITMPKGAAKASATITFPSEWWGKKSKWRLSIPQNNTSEAYTTKTLTITAKRKYQNPSRYVQIADEIGTHGYGYYVSKILVNANSTKSDHIEAMIKTANKYKGDKYVNGRTGAPGKGIDASGLVIQACYGAGVDLWPISPSTRPTICVPKIMDSKLATIKYTDDHVHMTRGDLIFFQTAKNFYGHIAIYLGYGKILHASHITGRVENSTLDELTRPTSEGGLYGFSKSTIQVRRIFN